MTTHKDLIDAFYLTADDKGVFRGLTMDGAPDLNPYPNFVDKPEWSDGGRNVWVNQSERAIFTYCEGDLSLETFSSELEFDIAIHKATRFYSG